MTVTLAAQDQSPCPPSLTCAAVSDATPLAPPGQLFGARLEPEARRPTMLVPLYMSFFALQALDVHSTLSALDTHGEANPVIRNLVSSPVAFTAIKVGTSVAVVLATDRLRKRHPVAAVAVMFAMNSAFAAVVAHNYIVAGRN